MDSEHLTWPQTDRRNPRVRQLRVLWLQAPTTEKRISESCYLQVGCKRLIDQTIHPTVSQQAMRAGRQWPWWRTTRDVMVLPWFILIHVTALVGLVLFSLPGWRIVLAALALAWIGGIGTTVCYHRALAHRALRLNPVVQAMLIFFAMFNGSGSPVTWAASHRVLMRTPTLCWTYRVR